MLLAVVVCVFSELATATVAAVALFKVTVELTMPLTDDATVLLVMLTGFISKPLRSLEPKEVLAVVVETEFPALVVAAVVAALAALLVFDDFFEQYDGIFSKCSPVL